MEQQKTKEKVTESDKSSKLKGVAFLVGACGISLLTGFGYAVGSARKSDPKMFDKGLVKTGNLHYAGSALAMKALGWGTLFAIGGVSLLCGIVWKLSGANNMQDFRMRVGNALPRIPKNDPPQGRTEFRNLTDLLQYIIDEDLKNKTTNEGNIDSTEGE